VDNAGGRVLGEGHNALVQEGNPILHGEMAALRSAGRLSNRHNTTMYTTLQPCFMCTGAIVQFGIPRVVVGDVANASGDETLRFLRGRGVEVIVLDPAVGSAARQCVELAARFRAEKPDQWLEDWGGGQNPALL
jgi:cytosine deaminase